MVVYTEYQRKSLLEERSVKTPRHFLEMSEAAVDNSEDGIPVNAQEDVNY